MPKPRLEEHKALPHRWRRKHGAYYYRVPAGDEYLWEGRQDFRLGATLQEAFDTFEAVAFKGIRTLEIPDVLPANQILRRSFNVEQKSGIYFLIHRGEVVYVGQAINMFSRALEHDDKEWSSVTFLPADRKILLLLEARYIRKFRPKYNVSCNGSLG